MAIVQNWGSVVTYRVTRGVGIREIRGLDNPPIWGQILYISYIKCQGRDQCNIFCC